MVSGKAVKYKGSKCEAISGTYNRQCDRIATKKGVCGIHYLSDIGFRRRKVADSHKGLKGGELEEVTAEMISRLHGADKYKALRNYRVWVAEQRKKDRSAVRSAYHRVSKFLEPERYKKNYLRSKSVEKEKRRVLHPERYGPRRCGWCDAPTSLRKRSVLFFSL